MSTLIMINIIFLDQLFYFFEGPEFEQSCQSTGIKSPQEASL